MNVLPTSFKKHLIVCSTIILAAHAHFSCAKAMKEEETPRERIGRMLREKAVQTGRQLIIPIVETTPLVEVTPPSKRERPLIWHDGTPVGKTRVGNLQFIPVNPGPKHTVPVAPSRNVSEHPDTPLTESLKRKQQEELTEEAPTAKRARRNDVIPLANENALLIKEIKEKAVVFV